MVTSGKTNTNKSNNTINKKNNASDPVFDSINPDTNTNPTTLAHTIATTTHTTSGSRNYNNSNSNSNSNINDNNFTNTSNDNNTTTVTTTITSDTLNKVIDDVTNNDVHNVNNEVLCIAGDGNNEEVKNVAAVVMSDNMTQQNIELLPKPSPSPQVIIIPRTTNPASTVATNAAKKIRRAFSMPRNPFRWTHKMKTSAARATNQNSNCTGEHKTGRTQDSGGGGGGMNFSAISKSYTLSSCVGGKRERAESFLSLKSNDDNNDGSRANINNKTHNNTSISSTNAAIGSKDTQSQSCMMPSKKQEEQQKESNDFTKTSNKKFTTKSNTIHGVSSLSSPNAASTTLANGGASLSSTMPAGTSNSNNNNNNNSRIFRRSSFRKFLNRIAQHVTASSTISEKTNLIDIVPFYTGCWRRKKTNKPTGSTLATAAGATANGNSISTTADRVPPISGYQWPNDQTPGVMGLKNHGNTCFMNAVLQCLSHTDILAEYFVLDQYKADLKRRNKINSRKFGTKGELTEQLANVLKALWTCKNESDHSTSFKAVVDRYGSQFRSSTQHDAQEFLFWLLDKVHEDLNTATKRRYKSVKNNYGRPDEVIAAETLANHIRCNNSFVQAVFQAQFRSSLTCPRCKKQSNTFDPFHCISVQLPQLTQQTIFVTVVYLTRQPRQVRMGLKVTAGSPIIALREQLHKDTGIPNERMVLVDLQKEGFMRVFYDTQPVSTLQGIETIYCIEVPLEKDAKKDAQTNVNSPQSADLLVLVANVKKTKVDDKFNLERFGAPFCLQIPRDCFYIELQKKLLKEMSVLLKPEVFSYNTPLNEMFQIRLQDPSADPDTFIEQVEHPLLTEMIDLALSVLSTDAGPAHIKLLLEWPEPEKYFSDITDHVVEHESVPRLLVNKNNDTAALTLEQCLEHYTKAETLSAEDAWRCPHCQEYLPVVKTLGLWSLPDILVVHFKRFRQHHGKGANAAKLTTMVKFPLHSFDMSPHLARGLNENKGTTTTSLLNGVGGGGSSFNRPSPWRKSRPGDSRSSTMSSRENRETRYDLYAVCYHQGDTLETGHYTAACKNPYDRQWYKFDDQRVTKVCSDALPDEIVNNEAYMLFYQRRTSENAEYSGSSSNSSDHWVSRIAPGQAASCSTATSVQQNNVEKVIKSQVVNEKPVIFESLEAEVQKSDSKEIHKIMQEKTETVVEEKLAHPERDQQTPLLLPALATTSTSAQLSTNENNLDALEKLLDYADADVDIANPESEDFEKLEKLDIKENNDHNKEILAQNEKLNIEENYSKHCIDGEITSVKLDSNQTTPINGFDKKDMSKLKLIKTNGDTTNHVNKQKTPTSSVASSLSSLSSQSHEPSSLTASKHPANNLQNKFNGFLQSNAVDVATTTTNEKEKMLSSSLKSNSSSIISSALAGHYSTYRQPWHGSRSSVSAVEPSTASGAQQHSSLHLRHSFSTASNYRLRECGDTLSSVLRNSVNTCSKDTLIFLDQQQHHHHHHHHGSHRHHHHHSLMEDDDDSTFMGSRSLWISPVTPHKLITVSPKN